MYLKPLVCTYRPLWSRCFITPVDAVVVWHSNKVMTCSVAGIQANDTTKAQMSGLHMVQYKHQSNDAIRCKSGLVVHWLKYRSTTQACLHRAGFIYSSLICTCITSTRSWNHFVTVSELSSHQDLVCGPLTALCASHRQLSMSNAYDLSIFTALSSLI